MQRTHLRFFMFDFTQYNFLIFQKIILRNLVYCTWFRLKQFFEIHCLNDNLSKGTHSKKLFVESGTETTLLLIEVRFMGIILLPIPMYPDLWELVIITIIICATTMAQIRIKVMDRFPLLIAQAHTMEIFWASKQLRYVLGYTNSIFIFYCYFRFWVYNNMKLWLT